MAFLPVAQYPNIVPPTIQITTTYPGASAEVVARTVATPLEQAINGVENMDYITSQSTGNGQLTITVIFKIGTDPNTDLLLTHNRVQDTLSRLPQEVQAPGRAGQEDHPGAAARRPCLFAGRLPQPRVHLQLHAQDPRPDRAAARRRGFQLFGERRIRHADLDRSGQGRGRQHQRQRHPDRAARTERPGLGRRAERSRPYRRPSAAYQINVEALGRLTTPEQFGDIIVKSDNQGRVTRIRDIGRVELGLGGLRLHRLCGQVSVRALVVDRHARRERRAGRARDLGQDGGAQEELPAGHRLHQHLRPDDLRQPVHPRSHRRRSSSRSPWWSASSILFLQTWRATIIPVVAIPISLVGTFTVLAVLGISINNLSLFGLVLAVGIVVDDAIVVVENVERNMALGMSPREAAHKTMDEVSTALIAIALTLCAVFVPIGLHSRHLGPVLHAVRGHDRRLDDHLRASSR